MQLRCVASAILIANSVLICLSIYWTVSSWRNIRKVQTQPPWVNSNCTVKSSKVEVKDNYYRNTFQVDGFSCSNGIKPSSNNTTTAYRYGSDVYNQTKEQANAFKNDFQPKSQYQCFVSCIEHKNEQIIFQVSMSAVSISVTATEMEFAITSTTFTVLALIVLFFLFLYLLVSNTGATIMWLPSQRQGRTSRNGFGSGFSAAQVSSMPRTLSRAQIDAICNTDFTSIDNTKEERKLGKEQVCAICLEENDDGPETELPCNHVFHTVCVRSWLVRGGITCPLCCSQLGTPMSNGDKGHRTSPSASATTEVNSISPGSVIQINEDDHNDNSNSMILSTNHNNLYTNEESVQVNTQVQVSTLNTTENVTVNDGGLNIPNDVTNSENLAISS